MIEPKTPPMRPALIMLAAVTAIFLLSSGCVTYHTYISQDFHESGDSDIVVRERLVLNSAQTQDYLAQSRLSEDAGPQASEILLSGLAEYYEGGTYARDICGRVAAPFKCAAQADGGIEISGQMQPDGRFYIFNTTRDWLELKETRRYIIRRAPLPSFFAYGKMNDTDRTAAEKGDLRAFLNSYIDRRADELPQNGCVGDKTLGCRVERNDGGLTLRLSPGANYGINLSRTRILRALCSFKQESEFGADAYKTGQVNLSDAYAVNRTLDEIGAAGLRMPCNASAQTLAVEVAYPAGVSPDASNLLVYRMPSRERALLMMHQSVEDNGTLMTALSKYSTGQFAANTAEFGPGRLRGIVFNDLSRIKSQGDIGADVQFTYAMRFPEGKITAMLNNLSVEMSGRNLTLSLERLSRGGTGEGVSVKVEKSLSPLGGYTWLAINLAFLFIMAIVVWHSLRKYKIMWFAHKPPKL